MRDQIVALKDKPDGMIAVFIPVPVRKILCRLSIDDQIPTGVMVQSADNIEQRRLAASALSQDRDKLVFPKGQRDAPESMYDLIAAVIILDDLL